MVDAARLINDFQPSFVHGPESEHCLGLSHRRSGWDGPTIVSLHGILYAYTPLALGELDMWDALRSKHPVDLCRMSGVLGMRHAWKKGARVERNV